MAKKKQQRVVLSRLPMRGTNGQTMYRVEKVTNRLDPPVGEIPDPARDPELLGTVAGVPPKGHALHATGYEDVTGRTGHGLVA